MKWDQGNTRDRFLHWAFEIGIWFKGVDGALELIGGILFLIASPHALNHLVTILTQHELNEDPGDWIANALRHAGDHLSGRSKIIGGAYLLGHGAVKLFLAVGILRGKLWCYPTGMAVITLFVLLESCRVALHFSFLMLFLILVDVAIVLLIWREYRGFKRQQNLPAK